MKTTSLLVILAAVFCFTLPSCGANSSNPIEFETLEGSIQKPTTFEDAPYDSIRLDYKIAWPVNGDEKVRTLIQGWIVDHLSESPNAGREKPDLKNILESLV